MRGVLVILGIGLAYSAQGGTITSGSFSVGTQVVRATVSGDNFTATVKDNDALLGFFGFPPFQAISSAPLLWAGDPASSVLYNGIVYADDPFFVLSGPFALSSFTEQLISPAPIVTGPGAYGLDLFAVTLHFSLFDSSHTMFYSETDTGFATGSITYTASPGTTLLHSDGFTATIIPEPSTWSCIALAACLLSAFAHFHNSLFPAWRAHK